jgi:hypothetical protein
MQKLTPEQAAIVSAYTGFLIGNFGDMHEAVERKLGRPVYTHEFPSLREKIREAFRADFIALNPSIAYVPPPSSAQA